MSLLKNDLAACLSLNHRHPSREDATSLCCPLTPRPTKPRSIIAHGNNNIDAVGGGGAVYRQLQAHHLQWLDSPRPTYCIRKTSCFSICKAPPWPTPVLPLTGLGSRLTDKQGLKGLFKAAKKRKKAASITGSKDVKLSRKVISLQLSKVCAKEGEQTEAVPCPMPKAQRACSTGVTWMDAHQDPPHHPFIAVSPSRTGDVWVTDASDG